MKYEVIDIKFGHPSFSWADGQYMIINKIEKQNELHICRLSNGIPELDYKGDYSHSVTGISNPGVKQTGLIYDDDVKKIIKSQYFYREDKLKRILCTKKDKE